MFKWLEKRLGSSQREEAQTFLDTLRGADVELIDVISAQTVFSATFYAAHGHELYEMAGWIMNDMYFPAQIASQIKNLQRNGAPTSTVGLQVWLHSSRALLYPELRVFGRDIWAELGRATPEAKTLAKDMILAGGYPPPDSLDIDRVPRGLERLPR